MKQFIGSLLFLCVPLLTAHGQDDVKGSSTVTFGLGAGRPANSYYPGGLQLNGTYEYRLSKHWAAEFGVDTTQVKIDTFTYTYIVPAGVTIFGGLPTSYTYSYSKANALATSMPFGFRGIMPLSQGKLELSAGGGGAYLWNPNSNGGWGWQATLGARLAVDKQRRFWLGTTGRYIQANSAYPSRWVVWSGDLSFRFGGR